MKAEHRKELETNILADRMGRMIQGARKGPSRSLVYWVIGILAVCVAAFIWTRWQTRSRETLSRNWVEFEGAQFQSLQALMSQYATTNVGKAAKFQIAWEHLWVGGIKQVGGANRKNALDNIVKAQVMYEDLKKDCKNDPTFLAEALYGLALIEETRVLETNEDPPDMTRAIESYRQVAEKCKETAFGKLAQDRVDLLEDPAKVKDVQQFYRDMRAASRRRAFQEEFMEKFKKDQAAREAEGAKLPKLDLPKIEPPKVETKIPDAPKTDAPKIDPKDLPKIEPPKTEAPKTEAPKATTVEPKKNDDKKDPKGESKKGAT
jgi:hypothetical protein